MNGQISALEVTPGPRSVLERPFVVLIRVQGAMIAVPTVVASDQTLSSLRPVAP